MTKQPLWKCDRCGKLVNYLFYCPECWRMICKDCRDPFVGVCKECVYELFHGEVKNIKGDNSWPLSFYRQAASAEFEGENIEGLSDIEEAAWRLYEKRLEKYEKLRAKAGRKNRCLKMKCGCSFGGKRFWRKRNKKSALDAVPRGYILKTISGFV